MTDSILVTGASRGIGRDIALALGAANYEVVVHYVANEQAAGATAEEICRSGGQARCVCFDVANEQACRLQLEADIKNHGAYYGVVLNAGIAKDQAFPMMSSEDWQTVMQTNLGGFYNVLNPLVMPMIRRRKPGRIVIMSSVAGITGNRGQTNYAATKAGLIGAAKSLALELAKRKITVNCVAPGFIATDMTAELPAAEVAKAIPMRRVGEPADVAGLVTFLCSEQAAYITKQVIAVDGGLS